MRNSGVQAMRSSQQQHVAAATATTTSSSTPHATKAADAGAARRERSKSVNTVAARMKQVVDHMIATQREPEVHTQLTVFLYKSPQSEIINAFFSELQKENATLFNSRAEFLALIATRYDEFMEGIS
jgi:hypothetical protein